MVNTATVFTGSTDSIRIVSGCESRLIFFCTHDTDWKELPRGQVTSLILLVLLIKTHLLKFFFTKSWFSKILYFFHHLSCNTLTRLPLDIQRMDTFSIVIICSPFLLQKRLHFLQTERKAGFSQHNTYAVLVPQPSSLPVSSVLCFKVLPQNVLKMQLGLCVEPHNAFFLQYIFSHSYPYLGKAVRVLFFFA